MARPASLEDEELTIEFEDDSGQMTEELLAMSKAADVEGEESPTEVGDTVEIDTGTLVAELEPSIDLESGDEYGDTVRLNLEDMGLDTIA